VALIAYLVPTELMGNEQAQSLRAVQTLNHHPSKSANHHHHYIVKAIQFSIVKQTSCTVIVKHHCHLWTVVRL
jgi:hypothetical protein